MITTACLDVFILHQHRSVPAARGVCLSVRLPVRDLSSLSPTHERERAGLGPLQEDLRQVCSCIFCSYHEACVAQPQVQDAGKEAAGPSTARLMQPPSPDAGGDRAHGLVVLVDALTLRRLAAPASRRCCCRVLLAFGAGARGDQVRQLRAVRAAPRVCLARGRVRVRVMPIQT